MPSPSLFTFRNGSALDPRSLLSSLGEVVYSWDIASDALNWGPNAAQVLGALPDKAMTRGIGFAALVEPGSGPSRYDAIFGCSEQDQGEGVVYRTRYAVALAGRKMWAEDTGRWFAGSDGRPASARGVVRLERAARAEELTMTGPDLCDRPALVEQIQATLQEQLPQERAVVVLVAAIDELARLNDDFGHEATDEIIATVHERLRSVTRRRDHLVRYAGNSFAILLAGCPREQIDAAAKRFSKIVAEAAIETGRGIALVRLRVGAAIAPELTGHAGELLSAAEGALAAARAGAIDDVVLAKPQRRRQDRVEPTHLDVQAISALNERRVRLALQPIVGAASREIAFYEALLRVGQPEAGLYFASAELVPLLERRGLVRLFDHRVLELALDRLIGDPALRLSVNVSPRSLADPEWLDAFMACAGAAGAAATRLIVEITETATIESPSRMAKLLARLKTRGVQIAIDDFGAGHTSLKHLRAFPIDILKIDGAFTQNLRRSTDDRFYVRTLIDLAGHLGVETVAEWVDDEAQATMLRDWGVTYLQGHLVGRAELDTPHAAASLLRAAG